MLVGAVALITRQIVEEPVNALSSRSALCLLHLRVLIAALDDTGLIRGLMEREALVLDRSSEDMRRYATKHDAIRRSLASDEEINAGQRALSVLAGLRNVNLSVRS